MAVDYTIAAGDYGMHKHPITANTPLVIAIELVAGVTPSPLEIINHGTDEIYVRTGTTCTVADPKARMVAPNGTLPGFAPSAGNGTTTTLTIISATDGTVSVELP